MQTRFLALWVWKLRNKLNQRKTKFDFTCSFKKVIRTLAFKGPEKFHNSFYASPVWANLPEYLSLLIKGAQKKPYEIIFPGLPYRDVLVRCGLHTLSDRCAAACTKFIQRVQDSGVLANLLPQCTTVSHGYNLHSATIREDPTMASTNCLDKYITYRYS